jgi:hypothetical protein
MLGSFIQRIHPGLRLFRSFHNKFILGEVGWGDVDWICLAKDRNRWRALVNSVFNL